MTTFEAEPFAYLNGEAAAITTLNYEFGVAAELKRPEWVRSHQGRIAKQQAAHLLLLGELAAGLPYEDLALASMAAEDDLREVEERLMTIDDEPGLEKLAVHALASRLIEEYGLSEETAEQGVNVRITEINAAKRSPLQEQRDRLSEAARRLSQVWEVAGEAWPIPTARTAEREMIGDLQQTARVVVDMDTKGLTGVRKRQRTSTGSTGSRERQVDQPYASRMIAAHLAMNVGRTVTVDELVSLLYGHCIEEGRDLRAYRSRITTVMGPQVQGERIQAMLEERGYTIWYGNRRAWISKPGKNKPKYQGQYRVYRTISLVEAQVALPEFVEIALDGEVVASTHDFEGHRTEQLARLVLVS